MLRMHAVNQFYGPRQILRDIHLELPHGQCTCLLGRNGVGKTTLINCIMGHVPVSSGSVTWQLRGEDAQDQCIPPRRAHRLVSVMCRRTGRFFPN